jgi:hypothetical protein
MRNDGVLRSAVIVMGTDERFVFRFIRFLMNRGARPLVGFKVRGAANRLHEFRIEIAWISSETEITAVAQNCAKKRLGSSRISVG